jgi:CubicO group peptidase (beta-lactamase class C family)
MVLGVPLKWGLGYNVDSRLVDGAAGARVAWWAGGGGSLAFVDLDRRMAFGYAPNRWLRGAHEQDRQRRLLQAVYEAMAR